MDCEKCPYIQMANRIKKNVKWVQNHAAVTVFVTALLFAIIGVPYILLTLEFDWLDSGDIRSSLISYYGGLLGGLLSLAGVYITIKSASKTRKNDLKIEYRPLLSVDVVQPKDASKHLGFELFVLFDNPGFDNNDLAWLDERLQIVNLGRGEVAEFEVGQVSCSLAFCPEGCSLKDGELGVYKILDDIPRMIAVGRSTEMHLGIPRPVDENAIEGFNFRLCYEVEMFARGSFSDNSDRYSLSFCVGASYCQEKLEARIDSIALCRDNLRVM